MVSISSIISIINDNSTITTHPDIFEIITEKSQIIIHLINLMLIFIKWGLKTDY